MHEMTKKTAIPMEVKLKVWERDGGCCIICGSPNASPNAHFIRRSQCGEGVEKNIVTLCNNCHRKFDESGEREAYGKVIMEYLKSKYPDWKKEDVVYDKWGWTNEAKGQAET